jgi:hypothetical protein
MQNSVTSVFYNLIITSDIRLLKLSFNRSNFILYDHLPISIMLQIYQNYTLN